MKRQTKNGGWEVGIHGHLIILKKTHLLQKEYTQILGWGGSEGGRKEENKGTMYAVFNYCHTSEAEAT